MREINLEYIDTFKHTQKERERERETESVGRRILFKCGLFLSSFRCCVALTLLECVCPLFYECFSSSRDVPTVCIDRVGRNQTPLEGFEPRITGFID